MNTLSLVSIILFFLIILVAIITIFTHKKFIKKNQKFALKQSSTEKTGYQVAREILDENGLYNVSVEIGQEGKDHYNPKTNIILLSPSTYDSSSVSAMAIAAHEVGHAIQWKNQNLFVRIREKIMKPAAFIANVGQALFSVGIMIFLISSIFWGSSLNIFVYISLAGLISYGAIGVFQLATLPLEFDASKKAKKQLKKFNMLRSEDDIKGTNGVLRAAAMTYVVQFLSTILFIAYWLVQLLILTKRK